MRSIRWIFQRIFQPSATVIVCQFAGTGSKIDARNGMESSEEVVKRTAALKMLTRTLAELLEFVHLFTHFHSQVIDFSHKTTFQHPLTWLESAAFSPDNDCCFPSNHQSDALESDASCYVTDIGWSRPPKVPPSSARTGWEWWFNDVPVPTAWWGAQTGFIGDADIKSKSIRPLRRNGDIKAAEHAHESHKQRGCEQQLD